MRGVFGHNTNVEWKAALSLGVIVVTELVANVGARIYDGARNLSESSGEFCVPKTLTRRTSKSIITNYKSLDEISLCDLNYIYGLPT